MRRRPVIAVLGVTTLFVAACSRSSPGHHTTTQGKPLIYEPTTGVTFSDDFNPYDPNSVASSVGMKSIIYEPLVEFDQLDPTAAGTHYWLATAYAFQNGGKDLQITLRTGVKFSDGSSFGPKDVAATFAAMNNPKADIPGVAPQVVSAHDLREHRDPALRHGRSTPASGQSWERPTSCRHRSRTR